MDRREILNIIYGAIIEVSPYTLDFLTKVNEDRSRDFFFVDLGINSINYAEIAHIVMDKLKVSYPLDIFARTNRINDVVDIFYDLTSVERFTSVEMLTAVEA
jgi:acyl carrier protein